MCGIAGIMYKRTQGPDIGRSLVQMLYGCQHRGKDSTGFALYRPSTPGQLILRFLAENPGATDALHKLFADNRAEVLEEQKVANQYRAVVAYSGDVQRFSYALEHAAKVMSVGESLEIIKDVGDAHEVNARYQVTGSPGTHGIGHVRLATESDVRPESAHPFWATGFSDLAIVHNGQITNYWKMRRALEARGFEFRTENDSELIAVYLAEKLALGVSLEQALEESIDFLDGTFSFLVSTKEELGYAKDRLAAKPMVKYESEDLVAIASEEVSINRLFPGQSIETSEPAPATSRTWSRQALARV